MASKQSVQSSTQSATAVISNPPIKDSPAVERALNRSKLYLLVSWSLLYPEDEEFLDYLQCGEFVEDGRAALDAMETALDGIGGDRAKQKLALMRKQFDQIEKLIASECVNWQLSELQAEHRRVFSNVITLDCPPYETLFGNDHVFAQSHERVPRDPSRSVPPAARHHISVRHRRVALLPNRVDLLQSFRDGVSAADGV